MCRQQSGKFFSEQQTVGLEPENNSRGCDPSPTVPFAHSEPSMEQFLDLFSRFLLRRDTLLQAQHHCLLNDQGSTLNRPASTVAAAGPQ